MESKSLEEELNEVGLEVRYGNGCDDCHNSMQHLYGGCKMTAICHMEFGDGSYIHVKPSADQEEAARGFTVVMSKRLAAVDELNMVHE